MRRTPRPRFNTVFRQNRVAKVCQNGVETDVRDSPLLRLILLLAKNGFSPKPPGRRSDVVQFALNSTKREKPAVEGVDRSDALRAFLCFTTIFGRNCRIRSQIWAQMGGSAKCAALRLMLDSWKTWFSERRVSEPTSRATECAPGSQIGPQIS